MITNMRHTGIAVTNMDQALKFYRDLLGLKVVLDCEQENAFLDELLALDKVKMRVAMLETPDGNRIELFQFYSHPDAPPEKISITRIGCTHVCFAVDDVDKEYQKLRQAGMQSNCPPTVSPDGYAKVTYAHDPDGTTVELTQILET